MSKTMRAMMEREETAVDILEALLDELDSAGAVLATGKTEPKSKLDPLFMEFIGNVALAFHRAKKRLNP